MKGRIFRYRKVPKQCLNCLYHKLQREAFPELKVFCPFLFPDFHDVRKEECFLKEVDNEGENRKNSERKQSHL
jgi:hypothetical protein